MDNHFKFAELPDANGPVGAATSATAVATRPPVAARPVELQQLREAGDLIIGDEPAADRRRPSTSALGGSFASVIFHLWLVAMLATLTFDPHSTLPAPAFDAVIATDDVAAAEPEFLSDVELADPKDAPDDFREAADADSVGQMVVAEPKALATIMTADSTGGPGIAMPNLGPSELVPQGVHFDERIAIKGTMGDAMVKIDAALDHVTWEIANHLQERKVLVIWMLDASGSLKPQRATIANRLRRIYTELGVLEEKGQITARTDQALLTGVVMYGEKTQFVTPEPTDKFDVIHDAVKNAPTDASGIENVFGAVEQAVHRWQKYRTQMGRSILAIIVTDETGDDFDHLEPAILTCRRYGAKAYVIGPAAVFGRRQAFVPYVAPEDNKTYKLPVDLGPESFALEVAALPFWFSASQYEFLSSGMGPYGLSRLVQETGGAYFLTTMTTSSGLSPLGNFDPQALKVFAPDYRFATPQEYINDVNRHRLRQAVMHAAELSTKYKPGSDPKLELRVTSQNYLRQLSDAQKTAAETTYMVDNILTAFSGNLEAEYEKESSPRWRANYNLTLGRLLALKARAYEYNYACAQLKQLGTGDIDSRSNRWTFKPSRKLGSGAGTRKLALEAERLLKRAIDEAPNTPWGLLAQRDLNIPFGFEVIQKYDPPPSRFERKDKTPAKKPVRLANDEKAKKKSDKPPTPPPQPKLPKL
ncbi:MAG: VWA domain-containing protein [Planctomycetia bacterium]|nr:VWA domain-containing protein [Planctomycetia bacterium]